MKNRDQLFKNLEVGQEISIDNTRLPRVVEQFPAKGKEGDEDFESAYEGQPSEIELRKPMTATIVSLKSAPGKDVGIRLANPPKGTRWFDAHSCDGKCEDKFGWFVTLEAVMQSNPELFPEEEE